MGCSRATVTPRAATARAVVSATTRPASASASLATSAPSASTRPSSAKRRGLPGDGARKLAGCLNYKNRARTTPTTVAFFSKVCCEKGGFGWENPQEGGSSSLRDEGGPSSLLVRPCALRVAGLWETGSRKGCYCF